LKGYDVELAEMDMELKGLKTSLALGKHGDEEDEEDQEGQVEEMSRMMARMQAIKGWPSHESFTSANNVQKRALACQKGSERNS
jgi:hypothetical protein